MRILISNDDGITAAGVRCLANTLAEAGTHQITVVCPDRERSATGHALTLHKPLRLDPAGEGFHPSIQAWACSGTPSDCVKLGLDALLTDPPDWVISGINHGSNLGTDVLYSGTVSAAMEGVMEDIPSIAVSLASYTIQDFQPAAEFIVTLVDHLSQTPLPQVGLLNVNVPTGSIQGIKVAPLGVRKYRDIYEKRTDPRGKVYYWLAGEVVDDNVDPNCDIQAVLDGYISLTLLQPNISDHQNLPFLADWIQKNGSLKVE